MRCYSHEKIALGPNDAMDRRARSRTDGADGEGGWNGFSDASVALGDVLRAGDHRKRVKESQLGLPEDV